MDFRSLEESHKTAWLRGQTEWDIDPLQCLRRSEIPSLLLLGVFPIKREICFEC